MSIELKVPVFPESVADGTILSWNKKPGDTVKRDESLVDIETDKVVFEVPAPKEGVLEEILEDAGAVVTSGQVIGRMREEAAQDVADMPETAGVTATAEQDEMPFATPAARKLIEENGLDIHSIPATGSGHRILKEDVLAALEQAPEPDRKTPAENSVQVASADQTPALARSEEPAAINADRPEQRVPMTRLRARIAERLLEAQHNAAMLTTFNEVNMQPVMDLRARHRDAFEKRYGVRLGFMSFFVKAAIEGLRRFPELNASIDGTDIVYHGFFDIGVAVSSPRGLVVPVLRDADRMAMADVEIQIRDYAGKARDGSLSLEDITGGTFTLTNGGVFGSLLSTPILNPPQSGILGLHKIQDRPVAEDGEVVIRPMMNIALSYDHRLVDGREAVQFLVTIKDMLEDPARLMLGV
ncbi:2-oxoglutarate dehydrogenase E2 component [Thiogranum longum]|uniref:Dihydrolipoyllysine-residue succinyltransferase component of 2-oxoglutarate dehydrogenase complex n=1 Tax=Thiogranum longum TaxID=1537524 RepID=A0A4R1H7Z6_9GAMM|nr:2-oxoglutarate dehydrogenase complex dihydrolipoyllysine-residue succinyltransferase [Thiogranum longum]TCK17957.1 2-oxoglutarate dehydrogenase E2 component [Thiogranum longum]